MLVEKMIKRGVDPKALDSQKVEQATHKTVRQKVKLKSGIDKDTAKTIQKAIKDLKLKVNAQHPGRGAARQRQQEGRPAGRHRRT